MGNCEIKNKCFNDNLDEAIFQHKMDDTSHDDSLNVSRII